MTATATPASKIRPGKGLLPFDPQDYRVGPVGVLGYQLTTMIAMVWGSGSLAELTLPATLGLLPVLALAPCLVLTPKTSIMQFPISLSMVALLGWIFLSYTWSVQPEATYFGLIAFMPTVVALIFCGGMLTLRELGDAVVWSIRLIVIITIVGLLLFPEARVHISTDPYVDDYPGWHGLFLHKNEMSPILAFGVSTVLVFDKNRLTRWPTLVALFVLLIGSTSATGLTSGVFAMIVWFWLRVYTGERDTRNRSLYIGVTILGAISALVAVVASVATVTSAYGKDTTFSGRTIIWDAAFNFISERPFLGYGWSALFWRFPIGPETAEFWRQVGFQANNGHNGPIDLALHIGLIGLGIFMVMWAATLAAGWKALSTQRDLGTWVVTLMAANLLMAFSENVFFAAWIGIFAMCKMLLMRRPEFVNMPARRFLSENLKRRVVDVR